MLVPFDQSLLSDVDYTTFVQGLPAPFDPILNDEHTAFVWAPLGDYPQPLHPGAAATLDKLTLNETDVAEGVRDGRYPSPSPFHNVWFFAIRITGTGVAFRNGLKEFVYRPPDYYLNDGFLRRCLGLPVIFEHPAKAALNTQEFGQRVVGTIVLPFIGAEGRPDPNGSEVWAIARVYDQDAAAVMRDEQVSTSPTVVFPVQAVNTKLPLPDGETLLVENDPPVLDHIAIVPQGVWDKGNPPNGVKLTQGTTKMPEETVVKAGEPEKKADANDIPGVGGDVPGEPDMKTALLSFMDSMSKRMDAMATRMDSMGSAKQDATNEPAGAVAPELTVTPEKVAADALTPEMIAKQKEMDEKAVAADKARADADEGIRNKIAAMEAKLPVEMSDDDMSEMADSQARADSVYQAFGKSAPRPLNGERPFAYRRRLVAPFKLHSKVWGKVELKDLPDTAFPIAEQVIYADAMVAACTPAAGAEGTLIEQIKVDHDTGRRIRTFYGHPDAWLGEFKGSRQVQTGINKES